MKIDETTLDRIAELARLDMRDPDLRGDWFGRFITTYRVGATAAPGDNARSRIEIEWDLQQGGTLQRHPWTRMAWRQSADGDGGQARLYVAGADHPLPAADASRIAASAAIDGGLYQGFSEAGRDLLMTLLAQGHYRLQLAGDDMEPESQ